MKTFNQTPDTLFITMIKLSIFFMLCLIVMNCLHVRAQTPSLKSDNRQVATVQKVRKIYTSQIGIREKHSNSGPDVEKYLRYVNLPRGNPWCAAFVCWVLREAGVPNPRTGWSPGLFPANKVIWEKGERGKVKGENPPVEQGAKNKEQGRPQDAIPRMGDVFGIYFAERKRIAHVGFIDQWDGTWLISVEGNTNITGSREGDGVYRKRRLVRSVYKVARYVE